MISLPAWVFSPLVKWGAIALGAVLIVGGFYWHAYNKGWHARDVQCQTAALRAELKTLQEDLKIQREAAESARAKAAELDDLRTSLQRKVTDYEKHLIAHPRPECGLTADDIERVRGR